MLGDSRKSATTSAAKWAYSSTAAARFNTSWLAMLVLSSCPIGGVYVLVAVDSVAYAASIPTWLMKA